MNEYEATLPRRHGMPWHSWEDKMVSDLVWGTNQSLTVQSVAKSLERLEHAILCRIQKNYGRDKRLEWETNRSVNPFDSNCKFWKVLDTSKNTIVSQTFVTEASANAAAKGLTNLRKVPFVVLLAISKFTPPRPAEPEYKALM